MAEKTKFEEQPMPATDGKMVINGIPLQDMNDEQLAAAAMHFRMNSQATDMEFFVALRKYKEFHMTAMTVLFEQERRKNGITIVRPQIVNGSEGKKP